MRPVFEIVAFETTEGTSDELCPFLQYVPSEAPTISPTHSPATEAPTSLSPTAVPTMRTCDACQHAAEIIFTALTLKYIAPWTIDISTEDALCSGCGLSSTNTTVTLEVDPASSGTGMGMGMGMSATFLGLPSEVHITAGVRIAVSLTCSNPITIGAFLGKFLHS